jgi:IS5 family transposase
MPQPVFFDVDRRLESIRRMGDPLERLAAEIPWELFRPLLETVQEKERKSAAGRKPLDVVLMFKVLILQTLYNLADEAVEYQIRDRLSFMRFLGLELYDSVPNGTTVWWFRERLKELELIKPLFDRFGDYLAQAGLEARNGRIVDDSIVPVPIQRNTREENRCIKAGEVPEDWDAHKRRQNDTDARWTKKRGKSHSGYKNHIDVDAEYKLIRAVETPAANVRDSQVFEDIIDLDNVDPQVWANSAYRSEASEAALKGACYASHVCEKGQSNQPLSGKQQAASPIRPKTRARVEHVFGFQQNSMGGKLIRTIGKVRAEVKIGCMNLTYKLMRYLQLTKPKVAASAFA